MAWRAERRNSKSTCCVTLTTAAPEKTSARLEFHYSPPREGKIQGSGNDLPKVLPSEAYPEVSSSLRRHFLQSCAFLAAKFFISISSTCPPPPPCDSTHCRGLPGQREPIEGASLCGITRKAREDKLDGVYSETRTNFKYHKVSSSLQNLA